MHAIEGMDHSAIRIGATKPLGRVARVLAERGIGIEAIVEDEGTVERYVISRRLVIERRTGGGFLKGIMEKTLFTSAIYLREHFRLPVLIVEGRINYEYSMMNPQAVRGALSSMVLQYGLTVLATADVEDTVELIAMMARQEQVGIPDISLIPKRKATDLADLQRRVIEMLPGCGMVMAREMLHHFGSVRRIVNAGAEELRQVRGVGAKTAAQMTRILGAEYQAVDTEKQIEDAIEAEPRLLFRRPVALLARQHVIFSEGQDKHVVDMVFHDADRNTVILVELKRSRLEPTHYRQLCRYLDNAGLSRLLRPYLDAGAGLRGILATVEPSGLISGRRDVSVHILNRARVIRVLKRLRDRAYA
jgi:ERCC4-type nuclease